MLRVADPDGPAARARPVRDARRRRALGRGRGRAALSCRAPSRSPAGATASRSSCSRTSAPARGGCASCAPAMSCGCSGRSGAASRRRADGRRAILVGGGVGIAPLAILQDALGGASRRVAARLPRPRPRRGRRAAARRAASPPTTARSATTASSPSCSRASSSATPHAVVYACGPAAMLEARARDLRRARACPRSSRWRPAWRAASAPASAASCRRRGGGYLRVCVDGPGDRRGRARARRRARRGAAHEPCDVLRPASSRHPVINGSGTFDAIAARARVRRRACSRAFPFAAYVSKTITLEPRAGNPPPRLWEAPGGLINSIGLPNKGLERLPRARTCRSCASCRRVAHGAARARRCR